MRFRCKLKSVSNTKEARYTMLAAATGREALPVMPKTDIVFLFCCLPSLALALAEPPLAATLFEAIAPICDT
jgi:hypothetical protein